MNGSLIKGLIVGVVIATAGGAIAGYRMYNNTPQFAEVVQSTPATEQIAVPREVCEDVTVTHKKPPRDKNRLMGTLTGAVVGGVLGNQVGGGNGKKLATVAGAAAGGYAGNKLQQRAQSNDVITTTQRQCETLTEYQEKLIGYDVTYRIGDEVGSVRMDADPGDRIPLNDGQLAIN